MNACGPWRLGNSVCDPSFDGDCGYAPYPYVSYPVNAPYSAQDDTSRIYGPFAWQEPPAAADNTAAANASSAPPETLLYLNDGSSYAVTDYWLSGSKLHYITNYGAENSLELQQIDLQRTVDANAARGTSFTLRPAPEPPPAAGPAPPGPQPPPQP